MPLRPLMPVERVEGFRTAMENRQNIEVGLREARISHVHELSLSLVARFARSIFTLAPSRSVWRCIALGCIRFFSGLLSLCRAQAQDLRVRSFLLLPIPPQPFILHCIARFASD